MRNGAWIILLGCLIGCNQGSSVPTAVVSSAASDPSLKQTVVPAEIESLFTRGEYATAVETLTVMINQSPRDENLFALRATARHRLGENDLAIEDLDRAIEMNGRDAAHYNNRGYMRLAAEQFQAAMTDFNKAIELAPRYKNAYNNRGLLHIAQKWHADAIVEFNRALSIDHNYVDAYNNRGFAEFELGDTGKALEDFNFAIQLNPEYVNAYNNRGLLFARAGDYENAMLDFTQAMMLDPLNPKYYEHRRDVYQRQGEYRKMVEDEKKIAWLFEYHDLTDEIAAASNPAKALVLRAKHFLRVDDYDKALIDLTRSLSLEPASIDALVTRGGVYLQRKAMSEARADAEAALAIKANEDAFSILGEVYLSDGNFDQAIENFSRAHRVDPSVAEAYYGKSKALEKVGDAEQAKTNLDQALALDPDIEHRLR